MSTIIKCLVEVTSDHISVVVQRSYIMGNGAVLAPFSHFLEKRVLVNESYLLVFF